MGQVELAAIMNVTGSTVSQYETGKRRPDTETMQRLATVFGVSVDYLLGRTDVRELPGGTPNSDIRAAFRGHQWQDLPPEDQAEILQFIEWKRAQVKMRKGVKPKPAKE